MCADALVDSGIFNLYRAKIPWAHVSAVFLQPRSPGAPPEPAFGVASMEWREGSVSRTPRQAMEVLALVGARLPVRGVRVALRDLVARVRLHAVAAEQAPLEALLEGLVVRERRLVPGSRHG